MRDDEHLRALRRSDPKAYFVAKNNMYRQQRGLFALSAWEWEQRLHWLDTYQGCRDPAPTKEERREAFRRLQEQDGRVPPPKHRTAIEQAVEGLVDALTAETRRTEPMTDHDHSRPRRGPSG